MKSIAYKILIALSLILGLTACEKNEITDNTIQSEDSIYLYLDGLMHYWYYWNNEITDLDYMSYNDPEKLLEDYKVDKDKWSFIDKAKTINSYFKSGEDFGYGFYIAWDSYYNLRVIIIYNNTAAHDAGIRRGSIIHSIDGVPVKQIKSFDSFYSSDAGSMKFEFTNSDNQLKTVTLSKVVYAQNAVFETKVFDVDGKKTGYINYQSFLEYSQPELINSFNYLKSENVDELIVDLRYNSGGLISLAMNMADILVPLSKKDEMFFSIKHNANNRATYDTTVNFNNNNLNLDLSRVFFLTNEYSASASELVINGLKPHMDVLQIGGKTSGKPYSMYGFLFHDWLVYPVTAKLLNADNYGDYEAGIEPNIIIEDNHSYDWGDIQDPAIAQAINYIQYGNFDAVAISPKGTYNSQVIKGASKLGNYLMIMDKK